MTFNKFDLLWQFWIL